ncbi:MAG: glutamine--fructose-6-phosphate transaminase (isomerizing) [Planctomycetota bacterium]|nr:MAG: glutamine--fructose-6-phosphate transaminase (isomerizing) [Planctomycetota bacterium]
MCGIVGYIGHRDAAEFLIEGLRRLEYRGYDSAGIAVSDGARLQVRKTAGRVDDLRRLLEKHPVSGNVGIGHTRWATHGETTDVNAHPHVGGNGEVVLVHNGVIENYVTLREQLQQLGFVFRSDTDSEVIAHLVAQNLREELKFSEKLSDRQLCLRAVERTVEQLHGTYGLVVLFRDYPEMLIGARNGSPLVVGIGRNEHMIASDTGPLVGYTEEVVYLDDREIVLVTADDFELYHREEGRQTPSVQLLQQNVDDIELGDYPHYMLKEIFEQPTTLQNCMRGRLNEDEATAKFGGLNMEPIELRRIDRIVLTACGTSWHAGLVGEYLLEEFTRIPVEVEYASELRYRNPPLSETTMVFAITQSGETADTLAAMRECKRKGHPTLAICNVVGSTIAREADGGIYLHAGPEIGVASTKAFTSQVMALTLLSLYLGRMRHLSYGAGKRMIAAIKAIPGQVQETLECYEQIKDIARRYCEFENFLYLGRLYNFPVALEGALKLKEISYIHAEGYPAAEMKHGPIALIDESTPSVVIATRSGVYPKVVSNLEEVKARRGPVIAIANPGDQKVAAMADDVIFVPEVEEYLQPLVTVIPLQLLAYEIAVLRGCNVDRPRNLAKSVTVE